MTPDEIDAIATRLFTSIEKGDIEGVASLYADDVAVWHNTSGVAQTREENLALLRGLRGRIHDWRYEEIRRHVFDGGFVQQHVLRVGKEGGTRVEVPVCIVVRVSGGHITRIDEYLDRKAAAALVAE